MYNNFARLEVALLSDVCCTTYPVLALIQSAWTDRRKKAAGEKGRSFRGPSSSRSHVTFDCKREKRERNLQMGKCTQHCSNTLLGAQRDRYAYKEQAIKRNVNGFLRVMKLMNEFHFDVTSFNLLEKKGDEKMEGTRGEHPP